MDGVREAARIEHVTPADPNTWELQVVVAGAWAAASSAGTQAAALEEATADGWLPYAVSVDGAGELLFWLAR